MLLLNIGEPLLAFRNTKVTVRQAEICLCVAKLITRLFFYFM